MFRAQFEIFKGRNDVVTPRKSHAKRQALVVDTSVSVPGGGVVRPRTTVESCERMCSQELLRNPSFEGKVVKEKGKKNDVGNRKRRRSGPSGRGKKNVGNLLAFPFLYCVSLSNVQYQSR